MRRSFSDSIFKMEGYLGFHRKEAQVAGPEENIEAKPDRLWESLLLGLHLATSG